MDIKIKDLKIGMVFLPAKKRKARKVMNTVLLNGDGIPKEHIGKYLVVYDNCKQMVCNGDEIVTLIASI